MTEFNPLAIALLLGTGFVAGIVNTLAGGGSNLTVPALMVLGMPADVANATNRIGVVLQSAVAVRGFHRAGRLDTHDVVPVLLPNLIGGLIGSVFAARIPIGWLKPMLLGTMIGMSLLILLRPAVVAPPLGTVPFRVRERPLAWLALFVAGLYGGFVQGGVGFVLIAALAGTLRYDLVRTNALKAVCTLAFTLVSLAVFIAHGQVLWLPGLLLGSATMAGAALGVRYSLKLSPAALKWFLFLMTVVASAAAMLS
jgi:uncharacterized membrane protein YfcA